MEQLLATSSTAVVLNNAQLSKPVKSENGMFNVTLFLIQGLLTLLQH